MDACLVDLRCLQDPPFRDRGIGRHARTLLSYARTSLPRTRVIGITDHTLPPLAGDVRAMADGFRTSAYTGALTTPTCFVQLSPMTHDPLFVARLLHHPAIPAAAAVYDFIPLDEPERYLPGTNARLDYHVALRWLARHQLFLPISADAAGRLRELLGVHESRIVVTGAPLAAAFSDLGPGQARHVLVIGGGDSRKNPECAIRAHARSALMRSSRIPLVVTGSYSRAWLDTQQGVAASLGGDPSLVLAPGHVDEASLLELYQHALCVIAPSRAEGFSLPVIEAMAAGVPVLASDIPVHRELLSDNLFRPEDDVRLADLLNQVALPSWRAAALTRQAAVWPRFRAQAVAERFWSAVTRLRPAAAPSKPLFGRARVALLTPLPPDRSGVADYSAATCQELGRRVELHVFSPTLTPEKPAGAASVNPLSLLPMLSNRFDRVISVLGNSVFHLQILRYVLRYGGAVISHDGRMVDLYAGHIGFEHTHQMAEAELGRTVDPQEIWQWLAGDVPPAALILSEVAGAAEPLMMHSSAGVAEVARRYRGRAVQLPFCLYRTVPEAELTGEAKEAARNRLGIGKNDVLLVSFGYVHPSKAPFDCIWATELLRSWGVNARLHFVGAPMMPTQKLRALARELGLVRHMLLPEGFVDEQAYRDHLIAADVGIQLRINGTVNVSGALADCIAAGLPSVASHTLASAVDAPRYVRAVPDNPSPVLVAEAIVALLQHGSTCQERLAYAAAHGFAVYTDRLCAALGLM